MLVLAVDVSHSPARPMMSRPEDSWLKNRGWPKDEITQMLDSVRRPESCPIGISLITLLTRLYSSQLNFKALLCPEPKRGYG